MSNTVSLKSIKDDVEKKYAALEVDLGDKKIEVKQILRLGDKNRTEVINKMDQLDEERDAAENTDFFIRVAREVMLLAAEDDAEALEKAAGGDPLVFVELFHRWTDLSQPGEAEPSQD